MNYCSITPPYIFSICSYYSLLGYRSQLWLHQYSVASYFLVTIKLDQLLYSRPYPSSSRWRLLPRLCCYLLRPVVA
jgi:hypothetical protein